METLGKILKLKHSDSISVHHTTQYRKLNQEITDDERDDDDDDVVFLRRGIELKHQNGYDVDHSRIGNDSDIDLKPHKKLRPLSNNIQIKTGVLRKKITKKRLSLMLFILLVTLVTALALVFLSLHRHKTSFSQSWVQEFMEFEAASNAVMYDVDDDGVQDIIISFTTSLNMTPRDFFSRPPSQIDKICNTKEGRSPCMGRLVAMRGHDGEFLWETTIRYGMKEMKCGIIDVVGNKSFDCIASGYMNGLIAFNPKNGHVFWVGNSTTYKWGWMNVGFELLMDLNSDNIPDIVVIQSSHEALRDDSLNDTETGPQSMLLLVDGSTGNVIGQPMNLYSESHFSPVVYKFKDESVYILFGTGTITKAGSLHAVSLKDFYSLVMTLTPVRKPVVTETSTLKGSYKHWNDLHKSGSTIELVRGFTGGIITPPLLLDVDNNGVVDIVVASCDGNVTVLSGEGDKILWSQTFPNYYPAGKMVVGYFNDDDSLDVLVRLNLRPHSNLTLSPSIIAILDGPSGSILWSMNNSAVELRTTNLVASTMEKHRNFFMFWLKRQIFYEPNKRDRRYIKDVDDALSRRARRLGDAGLGYDDYFPSSIYGDKRGSVYGVDNNPVYGDYDPIMEYDQPLPSRRRPYPPEYYPVDPRSNKDHLSSFTKHSHKSTKFLPSTSPARVDVSTALYPIQSKCRPRAEYSFLVGLDRYSMNDPFILSEETSIPFDEVDDFLRASYNNSLYSLKPVDEPSSSHWCFSSVIENTLSSIGDFENDFKLDLVSVSTLSRMIHDQHNIVSKASRKLRISKINLELKMTDIINKRLESLSSKSSSSSSPSQILPLKASKLMTQADINHYSNFKFRFYSQQA